MSDWYHVRQYEASLGSLRKSILCCEDKEEGLDKGDKDGISHGFGLALLLHVLCGALNGEGLEPHKGTSLAGTWGWQLKLCHQATGTHYRCLLSSELISLSTH